MESKAIFRRLDSSKIIIEGMEISKKEMMEKGVWNDEMTLEEWVKYAASNINIVEG
jgi:hypothetical protein